MVTLNLHSMRANNYRVVGYRVIAAAVNKVIKIRPNCFQSNAQRCLLIAILTIGYVLGSAEPKLSAFNAENSNSSSVQSFCKHSFPFQEIRNHVQTIMFVKPPLWIQSSSDLALNCFVQSHKVSEQAPSIESVSQSFDEEERRREEKIAALAKKGPSIANKMMEDLRDKDSDLRVTAVKVLGRIKHFEAVPILSETLENDKESEVRSSACEALGVIGDPRAMKAIIRGIEDPEDDVRLSAAFSLIPFYKDPHAQQALQMATRDENRMVASAAVKALKGERYLFDDPIEPLIDDLEESPNRKSQNVRPPRAIDYKNVVMPQFKIINQETGETPVKTQVVVNILVSGSITEDGLRALLLKIYDSSMTKGGYKYHPRPTVVAIYAYTSKEKYEAQWGQWTAMLLKHGNESDPKITVRKEEVTAASIKPEERFGLSEDQRIKIWQELFQTFCRAEAEGKRIAVEKNTKSFRVGAIVTVSKQISLGPESPEAFDSTPLQDFYHYGEVPEGSKIKILGRKESTDDINFHATMLNHMDSNTKQGWVAGSELIQATGHAPEDFFLDVNNLQEEIEKNYEELVAKKYNFTRYHTGQIYKEGLRKRWPYPKVQ